MSVGAESIVCHSANFSAMGKLAASWSCLAKNRTYQLINLNTHPDEEGIKLRAGLRVRLWMRRRESRPTYSQMSGYNSGFAEIKYISSFM